MIPEKPKSIKSQIYLPKCNICGLKFLCEESLDRHKSKPHFGTTYSGKIGKYQCDFDGKFFAGKDDIYIHMRNVHCFIRKYKCEVCCFAFKRNDHLKKHKQFACKI
ncbi:hypothetical protein ACKWTF_015268 [Chironomus riparius]